MRHSWLLMMVLPTWVYVSTGWGRRQQGWWDTHSCWCRYYSPGYMWVLGEEGGSRVDETLMAVDEDATHLSICEYWVRKEAAGLMRHSWLLMKVLHTWVYVSTGWGRRQQGWWGTHGCWWRDHTGGPDRRCQLQHKKYLLTSDQTTLIKMTHTEVKKKEMVVANPESDTWYI